MHRFVKKHKTLFLSLGFLVLFSVTVSYATPPASPYNPGDTLDPGCVPGSTNCTVSVGGTNPWSTVTGGINYAGGKVGIGAATPRAALDLEGDGTIIALQSNSSGNTVPDLGAGTRLTWDPATASFRAGAVDADQWDAANTGYNSIALGFDTIASGGFSTSLGYSSTASGAYSTALGEGTYAGGNYSTALGSETQANADYAAALGYGANASGLYSIALGFNTSASGQASTALGQGSSASGQNATAFGALTNASGNYATASGYNTTAGADYSTTFGAYNTASGLYSTAFGRATAASGDYSTIFSAYGTATAAYSTVMGRFNTGGGTSNSWVATDPLFEIGNGTDPDTLSDAILVLKNGNTTIGGDLSVNGAILSAGTFGSGTAVPDLGEGTRMMWYPSKAAFRAGYVISDQWDNANVGDYSVALGYGTVASGFHASALGALTTASGDSSTALGYNTTASGYGAVAGGNASTASGDAAVAFGESVQAVGNNSSAFGSFTTANSYDSFTIGANNIDNSTSSTSWISTDPLFIIGNGPDSAHPSNAITVLKNGNVGIGTASPTSLLSVGAASQFQVNSSGTVTIQTATAPQFVISDGTNSYQTSLGTVASQSGQPIFQSDAGYYAFQPKTGANAATRFYLLPVGSVAGTASKFEMFSTDYISNTVNYGGFNMIVNNLTNDINIGPNRGGTGTRLKMILGGDYVGSTLQASAPMIEFNTDNSLQLTGNNRINFRTAGSDVGNWNSIGLGIGLSTTSYAYPLDENISTTGGTVARIKNPTAGTGNFSRLLLETDISNLAITGFSSTFTSSGINIASSAAITSSATGGLSFGGINASGVLRFYTGGSAAANERIRILSNGNVGIGTTSPNALQENLSTTEQLRLSYSPTVYTSFTTDSLGVLNITAQGAQVKTSGQFSSGSFTTGGSGSSTVLFVPSATGAGSTTNTQYQYAGSTTNYLRLGVYGSSSTALDTGVNYSSFMVAGAPITTFTSGTHPWLSSAVINPLGTVTNAGATVTNTAALYLGGASAAGTNNYALYSASGNNYFGGSVGVGNAAPAVLLHVGSSGTLTGTTVARFQNAGGTCDVIPSTSGGITCSSDMTLKKNISNLADGSAWSYATNIAAENQSVLSEVLALNPVRYNWNVEGDSDQKHAGFIAQEVRQVFPDLVSQDPKTNLLSLNYTGLVPYTVEAIKEMNVNITSIGDLTKQNTWRDAITAWFADTANGIGDFVANRFKAKQEICINDTCINESQLKQLLQNQNTGSASNPNAPMTTTVTNDQNDPAPATDQSVDPGNTQSEQVQSPEVPAPDSTVEPATDTNTADTDTEDSTAQ